MRPKTRRTIGCLASLGPRRRRVLVRGPTRAALAAAAALAIVLLLPTAAQAELCTEPVQNEVACENTKPGTPESRWRVSGTGDPSIQGFSTSISVNRGNSISFKIKTDARSYHIDIFRLGWYGGNGARLIAADLKPSATLPQTQPDCLTQASTGLIDCGNWAVSATWAVPSTVVSGVYLALLVRDDTGGMSQIPFVVRDDASNADIALQTNDTSWVAYNNYGGNSLYKCTIAACPSGNPGGYKAAYKSSYNKPFTNAGYEGPVFWHNEYSMVRFLEANGYDLTYISGFDVHKRGQLLLNHKVFVSSGHDEYWSATQRANAEAARDAGVNLAFFSGNEVFWKTRWEPSIDASATADRTIVSYKDTHFDARVDPVEWTGTWRDRRFGAGLDDPQQPENSLTGQFFVVNQGTTAITVPAAYGKLRLWRNTAAASLSAGQSLTLAPSTLGYEWDEDVDNGFRPKGIFRMSSTTATVPQVFNDYGTEVTEGTATHHLTMYRAPSGARVFGAGTVLWSWGLDSWSSRNTPDRNMQQATVNLFADMGAQPATLMSGLVAATPSTDATAPTSTITAPASGGSVADGAKITVSGSASDLGGGVVAGVEISTDGGATWHPANGTTSWSYTWIAHGSPTTTLKTRAVDDSGNIETPGSEVAVNVACPCSIWGDNVTPATPDSGDANAIEVGVKFRSDTPGQISGIRFYKATANTGTHVGSLWTAGGQRLAQATFTGESASGWQKATFAEPVTIAADTTYVASYFAPNGHYSTTRGHMYADPAPPRGGGMMDSRPLHALRNAGSTGNGVFAYTSSSTFPTSDYKAANYWVDVMFIPDTGSPPGQVTGVSAVPGEVSATVSWTPPEIGPVTSYKITPYIGTTAQAATVVGGAVLSTKVGGLTAGTAYTFTVQAANTNGAGPESAHSNAVVPLASTATPPGAPTAVSAKPATRSAQVSWTAPSSDGGSPITGYRVTPYIGSLAQTPVDVGTATTTTIVGLSNDVSYTFSVAAKTDAGTGPDSTPSNVVTPQSTIFDFATPAVLDIADAPVELGVKFTADVSGSITGIRFYKGPANTGTHTGSLWTTSGQRLAQVTFSDETASGWQTARFSSPVAITAGTTYVASYHSPSGHYSSTGRAFASGSVDNAPLHAVANATSVNGVYAYGSTSSFPANSFNATNYWVDVLFSASSGSPPAAPTNVSATAGETSATVTWTAPSGPVSSYKVTPYIGTTAQPSKTVTGSPPGTSTTITGLTAGTSYTFTVRASNSSGTGPESAHSNAVTPLASPAANPPGAPTDVLARPATSSALVSWTAPADDGGSAITSYTVTPYLGTTAQTPKTVTGSPPGTNTTITGLTNGGAYTFKVIATNSAGSGSASAASGAVTPHNTIFDFAVPAVADTADQGPVELGVKFRSAESGDVTGIRFYKSAANTGTHVGSLWTTSGQRLAQATFSGETASGWQTAYFSTPVAIAADTTYVASYFAPNGHYAHDSQAFASAGVDNAPLHALATTTSANGVYTYAPASSFPTASVNATNYWVDVLFAAGAGTPPGAPTNVSATAGETSATVAWTAPSSGGDPITSYTVTPYVGTTAQSPKTVSGTTTSTTLSGLTAGTSYTFTVRAANNYGTGAESAHSNPVTPLAAPAADPPDAPTDVSARPATSSALVSWTAPADDGGGAITSYTVTPYAGTVAQTPKTVTGSPPSTSTTVSGLTNGTAYTFKVTATNSAGSSGASAASEAITPQNTIFDFSAPTVAASADANPVELGVKFRSDASGSVTGIRFYKGPANTGTHTGSLWTTSGQRLAQVTFSGETASGWQTAYFSTPVAIAADTTYVASYFAPNGHYSSTAQGFGSAGTDNAPLHALANTISANGVYSYGAASTFPTSTYNATNYSVDVTFVPGGHVPPGQVTNVAATAGDGSATVSWKAPSSDGGSSITSYTITPYIGTTAQTSKIVTGSPPGTNTTISGLTNGTTYTFKVSATNAAGTGPESDASSPVTPTAAATAPTAPTAPTNVTATAGNKSATVSWSAPSSNGGSPITSYTVRAYAGTTVALSTASKTVSGTPPPTKTTVTGLTNGTTYRFRVIATNAVGSSPESTASNSVTPRR